MTPNDFDSEVSAHYQRSMRWQRYAGRDVIPLWVADMDFAAPQAVQEVVRSVAADQAFGYSAAPDGMTDLVSGYCQRRYGWPIEPQSLLWLPGLVSGLHVAVRAAADGGDVLVMPPIYPPFLSAPGLQGATTLSVPLRVVAGRYTLDFDAIDAALRSSSRPRLLMLCHPHNPVGRAWRHDELIQLAQIVDRYDLTVCSDEVHCDLLLDPDAVHVPFASLPGMAERTITLMAPSKTYNVAGLGAAWAVVSNAALRQRVRQAMAGIVPHVSAFGFAAMAACVDGTCEAWRQNLITYLRGNRDLVVEFAHNHSLAMPIPEATFLAWLDMRRLDNAHGRMEAAGVGLSDGRDFGAPGFLRLNFGTQRALLREALARMSRTLRS